MLDLEKFFSNCNVYYVKDVDQWHELRGKGIGGSDASIVMNVSLYRTPYELWEEKTGKVKREFITNEAIEKGNVIGVQWHPEKMNDLSFFKNFINL